jgi:hypothetical protein
MTPCMFTEAVGANGGGGAVGLYKFMHPVVTHSL